MSLDDLSQDRTTSLVKVGGGEVGAEGTKVFDQLDDAHFVKVFVFHDPFLSDVGGPPAEFGEDKVIPSVGEFLFHQR